MSNIFRSFSLILSLILTLSLFWGCSDDRIACGDSFCGSAEVCENGQCELALTLNLGSEEESDKESVECEDDGDCRLDEVCTEAGSDPASVCIPPLSCSHDLDCQSGLKCGEDGHCR